MKTCARVLVMAVFSVVTVHEARASSGGILDKSGMNGVWCKDCHGPQTASGYTLAVTLPPGPYRASDTIPLTITATGDTRRQGFNLAVNGPSGGGILVKPASEGADMGVTSNQGRHFQPRFPSGNIVTWRLDWKPPGVGMTGNNVVRIYAASNAGTPGVGVRNVLREMQGTPCDTLNPGNCGVPVVVDRLPCMDVDNDGYLPTSCFSDATRGGGDCNDNNAQANPGATEVCDMADNDCDGMTDEGYMLGGRNPGQTCDGPDSDLCLDGIVTCGPNGTAPSCVETVDNSEKCNSVDDDCDGQTDEDFSFGGQVVGTPCDSFDADLCVNGVIACNGMFSAQCVETISKTELCNGMDDDCDGMTDEGYNGLGTACDGPDMDLCANGTRVCKADGTAVVCMETISKTELCNGIDDDCDNLTDETFFMKGLPCDGADSDQCRQGTLTCRGDGMGLECVNESMSFTETCGNNMDDDCNTLVDDGCPGVDAGPPPPMDAGMPPPVDAGGNAPDAAGCVPSMELCNGLDDNCDGQTDETFPTLGQRCDGVDPDLCSNGTVECSGDQLGTRCQELTNFIELCDGMDNDCDGQTDEGFTYRGTAVNQPCDSDDSDLCANGVVVCRADRFAALCLEMLDITEVCNGSDDNCDGNTDEGFFGLGMACDGPDTDSCALGMIGCASNGLSTLCLESTSRIELCNTLDDDCDGMTDEMCVTVDAGVPDASRPDASRPDAAMPADAAMPVDAAMAPDATVVVVMDASMVDASMVDASMVDAAMRDAAVVDGGNRDASVPDARALRDASGFDVIPAYPFIDRTADAGLPALVEVQPDNTGGCSNTGSTAWVAFAALWMTRMLRRRR